MHLIRLLTNLAAAFTIPYINLRYPARLDLV